MKREEVFSECFEGRESVQLIPDRVLRRLTFHNASLTDRRVERESNENQMAKR